MQPKATRMRVGGLALACLVPGLAIVALAAQAGGQAPAPVSVSLTVALPDEPTAGAKLFVQKGCVRCHALGGDESRMGPDLGRIHFPGTALDLAGAFWNHAPVMAEKMRESKIQQPTLDSREMADLLAFLTAYRYYVAQVGGPANPAIGKKVFEQKGCSNCHGDLATFDKRGPSLAKYRGRMSAIVLAQTMWNHGSEMATVMRSSGIAWPTFSGGEMGDLLAYVQVGGSGTSRDRVYFEPGSPRRGQTLFDSKGCLRCHAIAGLGGRPGPDLGDRGRDLLGSVASIAGLMWNHSRPMEAESVRRGLARVTFSGQEMADIIAYLYFVNYANVKAVPARGAQIFNRKCGVCHSAGGGSGIGPDLTAVKQLDDPIALFAAMWNHSARMEQELRRRGLSWPRLAQGEAADLAAFLVSRRPAGVPASR
ncbi:MAG: c-type cytochrome [Acidobacteriota bacterium]